LQLCKNDSAKHLTVNYILIDKAEIAGSVGHYQIAAIIFYYHNTCTCHGLCRFWVTFYWNYPPAKY